MKLKVSPSNSEAKNTVLDLLSDKGTEKLALCLLSAVRQVPKH